MGVSSTAELNAAARKWRDLLAHEREAAALYDGLAASESGERADILRHLATVERRHAAHWESRLREAGLPVPPAGPIGFATRLLTATAQRVSLNAVLPLIERAELGDAGIYDADPDAAPGMAEDERGHARVLALLRSVPSVDDAAAGLDARPAIGSRAAIDRRADSGETAQPQATLTAQPQATLTAQPQATLTAQPVAVSGAEPWAEAEEAIAGRERDHRGDRSGAVRAGVFGISDGLVSNAALVMGFAGSGANGSTVLLAGVAGLLAGSFSMAAGEYVSMSAQRELYEREVALEAAELRDHPEQELEELVRLYRAKGLSAETAREVAEQIIQNHEVALDTLAREELGLDPDALGSPWAAAASSMITFALGALVVVLPYLFTDGVPALVAALGLSLLAMAAVGAVLGIATGRSPRLSVVRQTLTGFLACSVTFGVGQVIGVQLG
ncbi:MAG TPA: VIT1/CCC1 transporter family protein [Kineosporiaceae bacterium]